MPREWNVATIEALSHFLLILRVSNDEFVYLKVQGYVQVINKQIEIHVLWVQAISDHNEMTLHLLEVIYAHTQNKLDLCVAEQLIAYITIASGSMDDIVARFTHEDVDRDPEEADAMEAASDVVFDPQRIKRVISLLCEEEVLMYVGGVYSIRS